MVEQLMESAFQEKIKKGVSLVDFYAVWCGPCKMMGPVLDKLSAELSDVTIFKLDVDQGQDVARQYQVSSIPTLVVFRDGKEKGRLVGVQNAESIKKLIQSA